MPELHARLSASAAKAWLSCGGFIAFNDYYKKPEEEESEYAKEGTEAHAMAEKILKGIYLGGPKIRRQKSFDQDMYFYVRNYVDYVGDLYKKLVRKYGKSGVDVKVEQRLDFSNVIPEGFGTGDFVILTEKELHIVDLKYGKGVAVSAYQNPQLMLYAVGALNQYDTLYDIETIVLHVAQVRMDEFTSYELSIQELFDWVEDVGEAARKICSGKIEYHPGVEQCRWCEGRAMCLERGKQLLAPIMNLIQKGDEEL
ncbi:MAG: DUF2800 domain-containing protein [Anaeroplasma bactoclasticum]|nr:DUF2800 domain-containing protein [Anaeroplasma bactoclasticum]